MKLRRTTWALAGALLATLAFPASGMAVTGTVTEFPLNEANSSPFGITLGPDGNVWAALKGGITKPIVQVKPDGSRTYFATEPGSTPYDISTAGNPPALWFTDPGTNKVGKITTAGSYSGTGGIGLINPRGIATGPNGHLYIVDAGTTPKTVVEFDPQTATKVGNSINLTGAANPQFIAKGPDNNMWVTDFSDPGMIFRVTTTTTPIVTGFTVGKNLLGVAAGPDGKVYFTEASGTPRIGRIDTNGANPQFTSQLTGGASDPEGLSVGQDGNIYTAIFNGAQVGQIQIAPTFSVTQFKSTIPGTMGPRLITKGGDGNEWYTNESSNAIGRFTVDALTPPPPPPPSGGGGAGGGGGGGATNGTTPTTPVNNAGTPQVSQVAVRPSRFRVGARATAVSAAAKTGTTITFVLTKDATATLSIDQAVQGRRRGSGCVRINRRNINGRKCTRFIPRGTLTRTAVQGLNTVPFTGRIGRRALKPGRYRLGVEGTDAEGRTGLFDYATFVVLPPKQKTTRRGR